jgi:hypothetical protein
MRIFTHSLFFLLLTFQVSAQSDAAGTKRPVAAHKKTARHLTLMPTFTVSAQGGFMYSGIEWASTQAEPVELVNILLEDETQRSQSGLISTETRPVYGHPYMTAELGFRSSFYQVMAYGGTGKFYNNIKTVSRYGIAGGLNLPISRWFEVYGNMHFEYDNSMNGMNLVTINYDASLSDKKRAAAEKLIMYYKDPNGQGAGFVTSQTAQYWSVGARIKKSFSRDRSAIFIGSQYLQSLKKPNRENITALTINGGIYVGF